MIAAVIHSGSGENQRKKENHGLCCDKKILGVLGVSVESDDCIEKQKMGIFYIFQWFLT